jgi:hypothetical protein
MNHFCTIFHRTELQKEIGGWSANLYLHIVSLHLALCFEDGQHVFRRYWRALALDRGE